MGSACSNLFFEDVCDLKKCVLNSVLENLPHENSTTWKCELQRNTTFMGKPFSTIWVTSFGKVDGINMHLISFMQQVVRQNICPFLTPILGIGHNCRPLVPMVMVQPFVSTRWSSWMATAEKTDVQLILFQLVYTLYVLQLGGYPVQVSELNLYVETKPTEQEVLLFFAPQNPLFFRCSIKHMLQVSHLPLNLGPSLNVLDVVRGGFPDVSSIKYDGLLAYMASVLQDQGLLFAEKGPPLQDMIGVNPYFFRTSAMEQKNVKPFHFTPLNPSVVKYRKLLQRQKEVQAQLLALKK